MIGVSGGHIFTATCTDDAWNELLDGDSGSTLHLYEVLEGVTITSVTANYAAGGAVGRIRDKLTGHVKAHFGASLITEESTLPLIPAPVTIGANDIVEMHTVATPT